MPASPIQNRIGTVFIPVSDMRRSIEWYSRVLGLPVGDTSHEGKIYDLPMTGETRLTLDAHVPPPPPTDPPRQTILFFWTDDVRAARRFLLEFGADVTSEVVDVGSVSFVTFRDPDGNGLMVCQRNGKRGGK